MRASVTLLLTICLVAAHAAGQEFVPTPPAELSQPSPAPPQTSTLTPTPSPSPKAKKKSWFSRVIHPFGSSKQVVPEYKDPKLRGLTLDLQISPQTVKLSEVRQLEIKLTLINQGKAAVQLDFANDQRVEIYLMDSAETVLTRWSDNHAVNTKPGTLLVNPGEHIVYNETISTRDLTPNKVFIVEVFSPKYPELRVRQKFLTAP